MNAVPHHTHSREPLEAIPHIPLPIEARAFESNVREPPPRSPRRKEGADFPIVEVSRLVTSAATKTGGGPRRVDRFLIPTRAHASGGRAFHRSHRRRRTEVLVPRIVRTLAVAVSLLGAPMGLAQTTLPDDLNPGANNSVYSMALQADGKILVGGSFTSLGGQPRDRIGRLNPDGTLDTEFNPGASGDVDSLALQADRKILVGGYFTALGGQLRNCIGRLNPDGTPDAEFNPGANSRVDSIALQADGKILVSGWFTTLGGQPRNFIGRLNSDGTLDTGFDPGADSGVISVAVQADGKILVGGYFTALGGRPRNYIGRLKPDGTPDTEFDPGTDSGVYSLAVQPDGKILVGGYFRALGGLTRNGLGRLNPDGALDTEFDPGAEGLGYSPYVFSLAVQADGRILVGGSFTSLGGQLRNYIGRLNPDGALDTEFNPGANGYVHSLTVQADGRILVGGYFTALGDRPRNCIGRLDATDPATQSLSVDGSTITWSRGGTSPEVWRTTFDWSGDGQQWTSLGQGTRTPGGWQQTNAVVPIDATIRARGYVTGGQFNGCGWFVEDYLGLPVWIAQPLSQSIDAGTTATLGGPAGGTAPLRYQWYKDGAALADGGHIAGATAAWLTLSNVLGADAGAYQVAVINADGARTSVVATLTVHDPAIAAQPAGQNRDVGETATLSVTAKGTSPLEFQWWKDGAALAGRTEASVTLTALGVGDAGAYWVVVTSPYGSATSPVELLTVNAATVDARFNPGAGGTDPYVYSLAVQADGKILVGGSFNTLGGQGRSKIGRLSPNGAPEGGLIPGASGDVYSLALQADGKILVGGSFTTLGGRTRNHIGRLNPDLTLDTQFDPGTGGGYRSVYSLAVQADGKILVGGSFTSLGGQPRTYLGRLNPDGRLDTEFNPGADRFVYSLALQSNGQILVGGFFKTLGGQPRHYLGRLNPDGTLDTGFDPGADSGVVSLVVQADGKILVGGYFRTLGGQPRNGIGRLNPDGTLDTEFNPGAAGNGPYLGYVPYVYSLAVQADGKILVGGSFTSLGGQPRKYIGRLNPDGTLDTEFNPGTGGDRPHVHSLALQADGKILVGGSFTSLGGQPRDRIGRLNATDPATQSLSVDDSTITWLRGGTSPEVWRTTFDWSGDGQQWIPLGEGTRTPGGWHWADAALPEDATIRARGFVTGGAFNSSGWFVEALMTNRPPAPRIAGVSLLGSGNVRFIGSGPSDAGYRVLAATNLALPLGDWLQIGSGVFTGGVLEFADSYATNHSVRFYQFVTP